MMYATPWSSLISCPVQLQEIKTGSIVFKPDNFSHIILSAMMGVNDETEGISGIDRVKVPTIVYTS